MNRKPSAAWFRIVIVAATLVSAASSGQQILQEVPKDGALALGVTVYVDDRKCPKGEIKEVTGGSREKDIPRRTRCVPKSDRDGR